MPVPVNKATLTRIRELKVALDLAAAVHEKTEKVVSDLQAALDALARRLDELATKERTLVAELIECKEQLAQKTAECELLARDRARSVLATAERVAQEVSEAAHQYEHPTLGMQATEEPKAIAARVVGMCCSHATKLPAGYCRTSTCECPDTCECKK